jgi:hypothetical protein
VWFVAEGERDIERIHGLAQEMGVRNYTIVGAQEGFRAVDELKRATLPIVVSVDQRQASQLTGRAFELNVTPPTGRNEVQLRNDSAATRALRANAATLARAGVPFALASYGMGNPAELRDQLRATIDAGLSADDALRALTVTPARLLGIEALVGTIDPGKFANLVVTQGDLFARDARVRYVFVDGIRFDVPAPVANTGQGQGGRGGQGGQGGQPAAIAGAWTGEVDGPTGLLQINLTITENGDSLTGRFTSEMGNMEMTGRRTGNELTLNGTVTPPGMNAMNVTITGRVSGDVLSGVLTPQGMAAINITMRRRIGGAFEREGSR